MKIRKANGEIVGAVIRKSAGSVVIQIDEQSTGIQDKKELEKRISSTSLNDCELVEATEKEKQLLKNAGYKLKGL